MQGKVTFVTGGGSGIGRAICQRFAAAGAMVVAADINLAGAEETVALIAEAGGTGIAVEADTTRQDALQAAIDDVTTRLGRIDIAIANAGRSRGRDIVSIDEETWDFTLNVSLKGTYNTFRAILPAMIARGDGVLLAISSVNGLTGIGEDAYSAAKAGVINLVQNLATRYGQDGIRANVICPGTIHTAAWDRKLEENPEALDRLIPWYPLRRVGKPEDIANAAYFLCSDQASWITGVTLPVDGGLMAGNYHMSVDLNGSRA